MRTPNRDDGIDGSVWGQKSFGKESLREPIYDIGNVTGTVIQNNLNSQCDAPAIPDGARGCVKHIALFHVHATGRHWHVRVKDVALSFPCPVRLLRDQHPLAMVYMGSVGASNHVRPRAVAQIAAASKDAGSQAMVVAFGTNALP